MWIVLFFGGKSDLVYELWCYEVICFRKEGYFKEIILNVIRKLFKGELVIVMMWLGFVDSIDEIL